MIHLVRTRIVLNLVVRVSSIHGSRDDISTTPAEGPEAGGHYAVEAGRLRTSAFRLMFMLSDIEPGGGGLRMIP